MEHLHPETIETFRHDRATRERKLAVCSGEDQLAPADRAEILVILSTDQDEMVADSAKEALTSQPITAFVEALQRSEAMAGLFAYASENLVGGAGIAGALVANRNCPARFLVPHVGSLSPAEVQTLMDSLDRVSESAYLATALAESSSATAEHKRLLHELLGPEIPIDEKVFMEALAEIEPDEERRRTLLERLSSMTVSERVQYAVKGGSEARRTLIRDANKVVQRAVLQSPRLTDQEVEAFAAMPSLTDEILRVIAKNRVFRKNYAVIRNLMNNSKTPLDVSLHMLPSLNALDLKRLTTNKNVPETLRTSAQKLHRTRSETRH